jgi:hypothetical protein
MSPEDQPWTTFLGKMIQKLQEVNAPEPHIAAMENELLHAIQCVRHVRKSYEKMSATVSHE